MVFTSELAYDSVVENSHLSETVQAKVGRPTRFSEDVLIHNHSSLGSHMMGPGAT